MKLSADTVENIRIAATLHDIGKISVPAEILSKPTKLTAIEFSLVRVHARSGYDILKEVELPYPIAQIVLQHHERMDGSGYPNGLKKEQILLEARILLSLTWWRQWPPTVLTACNRDRHRLRGDRDEQGYFVRR
jgi:HD-GYP domain-containing protein (c-di-GMP phosphodiesterase class II)